MRLTLQGLKRVVSLGIGTELPPTIRDDGLNLKGTQERVWVCKKSDDVGFPYQGVALLPNIEERDQGPLPLKVHGGKIEGLLFAFLEKAKSVQRLLLTLSWRVVSLSCWTAEG